MTRLATRLQLLRVKKAWTIGTALALYTHHQSGIKRRPVKLYLLAEEKDKRDSPGSSLSTGVNVHREPPSQRIINVLCPAQNSKLSSLRNTTVELNLVEVNALQSLSLFVVPHISKTRIFAWDRNRIASLSAIVPVIHDKICDGMRDLKAVRYTRSEMKVN